MPSQVYSSSYCKRGLGPFEPCRAPPPLLKPLRTACHRFSCSNATIFMVTSKASYSSAKVSKACIVFLVEVIGSGVGLGIFLVCCAETSLSVVEESLYFPQLCFLYISASVASASAESLALDTCATSTTRTVAALTLVTTFNIFNFSFRVVAPGRVAGPTLTPLIEPLPIFSRVAATASLAPPRVQPSR